MLNAGVRGPLTLVSAPAGYGKTVLAATWAARAEGAGSLAYQTVRSPDESAQGFWASALRSLQESGVEVSAVRPAATSEAVDEPMLATLAGCLRDHGQPVVWVLDCGEHELTPVIGQGLDVLTEGCSEHLRLVMLTRTDPPLPLHRYRLHGEVTEIRAEHLVFTAPESSLLAQRGGLDLDPVDVLALRARTGGWPAGMQFAVMNLAGRRDIEQAIREFRGDSGNVAEYLMTEVLAKQMPAIREFLLRTCVVDDLDARLAAALTGEPDDSRALEFLAHGGLLERVPGKEGRYRYPSLFGEFLRSQLAFERPELVTALHRTAAAWLAREGHTDEALQHHVLAGDWQAAAQLLVGELRFAGLLVGGDRPLLQGLFERLPPEAEGVDASVVRATLALAKHDLDGCRSALEVARGLLLDDPTPRARIRRLAIMVLDALVASLGTDLAQALDQALSADAALRLAETDGLAVPPEMLSVVAACKGRLFLRRGDLDAAIDTYADAARVASAPHLGDVSTEVEGMAALLNAVAGRLRTASEIATPLVAGAGTDVATTMTQAARVALAWVSMEQYDLAEVQALVAPAHGEGVTYDARVLGEVLDLLRTRLLAAQGSPDLARVNLRASLPDEQVRGEAQWLDRSLRAEEARLLLRQRHPESVVALLDGVETRGSLELEVVRQRALLEAGIDPPDLSAEASSTIAHAPLDTQVERLLVLAQRAVRSSDTADAEGFLGQALRLAAPEHLRRPFLEAHDDVRQIWEKGALAHQARWVGGMHEAPRGPDPAVPRQAGPARGAARPAPLLNPLTKKELEVLGHLSELLTTEEIATDMYVSVNTVRTHVRSILRKLGVARRNEAVRRAWELDLLPPPNVG